MIENILAIPSKNRIGEETLNFLKGVLINFEPLLGPEYGRSLTSKAVLPDLSGRFVTKGLELTVALLRPKDIVKMVASAEIPLGITGEDTVEEYRLSWRGNPVYNENRVQTLLPLGIGLCRLVLAVPQESGLKTAQEFEVAEKRVGIRPWWPFLEQFQGSTIASEYPNITRGRFIDEYLGIDTKRRPPEFSMKEVTGSVEAFPALGKTDAISDLVETGKTLGDNGLKELATIFNSQAVLITNTQNKKGDNPFVNKMREAIFEALLRKGNPDKKGLMQ